MPARRREELGKPSRGLALANTRFDATTAAGIDHQITGGSLNFLHSRVVCRHARRNSEKFNSVVVERLKFCSVLVALVDGITNGMLSKFLTVDSTTKLPTLFPAVERCAGIRRSVEKWGQEDVIAARTNTDRLRFGGRSNDDRLYSEGNRLCLYDLSVRGFRITGGRQIKDLSAIQSIYVGQLRVRVDEIIEAGLRSEITNGEFLDRITIPDGNLTSPLQRCGCYGLFLSRGAYRNRARNCWNYSHFRSSYPPKDVAFRSFRYSRSGSG